MDGKEGRVREGKKDRQVRKYRGGGGKGRREGSGRKGKIR